MPTVIIFGTHNLQTFKHNTLINELLLMQFLLCDATRSVVLLRQVVCLSICPSVTLRYADHIGWKSSKIISRLVILGCSLSADPNITDLVQGEHPEILAGIGEGYQKSGFLCTKALMSLKRSKMGPRLLV